MGQFGSETVIGPHVQLLVLDCFDTLVELGSDGYRPRRGVVEFLDHYLDRHQLPAVVLTDAEEEAVTAALAQAGLADRFERIYHAPDSVRTLDDGRKRKIYDHIFADSGLRGAAICAIGDSVIDAESARVAGVGFIRVPGGLDRRFSFTRLIGGASRYHSGEYTDLLLHDFEDDEQPPG